MGNIYETDKLLAEYLLFHYGSEDDILPNHTEWPPGMRHALGFTRRTAAHFSQTLAHRGLDIGCAVGGSSWEMARLCTSVTGIDFSHSFIHAANTLRDGSPIPFLRTEEARISTPLLAKPPTGIDPSRLTFEQGDAMNLRSDLGTFDRLLAANLLCRLPNPVILLQRLPSLVSPGGELIIATPCTWLEEFTPPAHWPTHDTQSWLADHLSADFELRKSIHEPFLIRETARKFQWTRSLVTVWKRKSR